MEGPKQGFHQQPHRLLCLQMFTKDALGGTPSPLPRKGIGPSCRHQWRQVLYGMWLSRPCHWLCAQLKSALTLRFMTVPVCAHCSYRRATSVYSFSFASHLLGTRCEWKSILVLWFFWDWLPKVCFASCFDLKIYIVAPRALVFDYKLWIECIHFALVWLLLF